MTHAERHALKPGDRIAVAHNHRDRTTIDRISKVNKLFVVTEAGRKFSLNDGCLLPRDKWTNCWMQTCTPEVEERATREGLIDRIRNADQRAWEKLTTDQLREIRLLVSPILPKAAV